MMYLGLMPKPIILYMPSLLLDHLLCIKHTAYYIMFQPPQDKTMSCVVLDILLMPCCLTNNVKSSPTHL